MDTASSSPGLPRQMQDNSDLSAAEAAAIRVHANGSLLEVSVAGDGLADLWKGIDSELLRAYGRAMLYGAPVEDRITAENGQNFWLVLVPEGAECLIVARDTTLPDNVMTALVESRKLLKALLDQAVDLAFEIDLDGKFKFVSPPEAWGIDVTNWLGKEAADIFWSRGNAPMQNPLEATSDKLFEAVPVTVGSIEKMWLTFNVAQQFDNDGNPTGLRCTCRDVSAKVREDRKARMLNLRLIVQQRITEILNDAETAGDLLDSAAKTILELLRAEAVWVMVNFGRGLTPMSAEGDVENHAIDTDMVRDVIAEYPSEPLIALDQDFRTHLIINLHSGDEQKGAVVLCRNTDVTPWSDQEKELLATVGDVLMAAFQKAELVDRLYKLSMQDELTGLLNRRAVKDAIEKRLHYHQRAGTHGTLVFIDLDNFKQVNDTISHAAGDMALQLVATEISAIIRPNDYAGRYGGDEFVVWLENAGVANAREKAEALIAAMPMIRKKLGNENLKLSVSAGIAQSVPGADISFEAIADRADTALYEVKASGKGAVAIADAPAASEEGDDA